MSEPDFHTKKIFTEKLLAIHMKNWNTYEKPVCLGLSILELSKILMYEFWYNCVKAKYGGKAKFCYMDTYSFIVYIKTDGICKDIAKDIQTRFDASSYE